MQLLAPEVKGPISICSTKVRIRGHIAGATVRVLVMGTETYSRVSNWPDDVFDVGVTLNAGDEVTAVQEFEGFKSLESPLPAIVQNTPSSLTHLTVLTHLHECGTAVWTEGAPPGAEVNALINNNVVGSAHSIDGIARIRYSPGLTAGQPVAFQQTTCNNLSNVTVSPPAVVLPKPLPTPEISEPLIECMTAIKISNVTDGATVTIYRDGDKDVSGAFDRSSLTWIGLKPLERGQQIEVDQSFMCRPRGIGAVDPDLTHVSGKAGTKVQSADSINKPTIFGPICPDAKLITLTNLIPGARVTLYQNGIAIAMTDAPEQTYSFSAPPLDPNAAVFARMTLCGKEGPMSDPAFIEQDAPWNNLLVSMGYACASYLMISAPYTPGGKIVYARNKHGDVISAYHQIVSSLKPVLIPISPALVAEDEITIVVLGCGGKSETFGPYKVHQRPDRMPEPVMFEPNYVGSFVTAVISKYTGALIRLYIDGEFKAQAISMGGYSTPIWLTQPLQLGQELTATQALCDMVSEHSKPVAVVIPPPQVPQLILPFNGQIAVKPDPVSFKWYDPGANTAAAADFFQLHVVKGNTPVFNSVGASDSYDVNLLHNTLYNWWVVAGNQGGTTKSLTNHFLTAPEPAPDPEPPPQQAILTFMWELKAGYNPPTGNEPNLEANKAFSLFIEVGNIGNATSEPFDVWFISWSGSNKIGDETKSEPALQPNSAVLVTHEFPNGLPKGTDYYFQVAIIVNHMIVAYSSLGVNFY